MNISAVIQKKLNQLIDILLTDGVQPGEIVDNIFLKEYNRMNCYKSNHYIINEVAFNETINGKVVEVILRYYYSFEKKLMKIEEEFRGEKHIEWDREMAESILVNDIADILKIYYTEKQMEKFITSLPENFKILIEKAYLQTA